MQALRLAVTTSTQDVAHNLPVGSVVVTDHQTSGRGRLGRAWEAPPGTALLASFVLPARPLATLAAGVAVAAACGAAARLKWPNDVLLDGRKLAGILAEQHGDRCILGVGVNVAWAPSGAARLDCDRERLLERLDGELRRWFRAADTEVLAAWRSRADTLGRRVRVELPGEAFEGVATDLTADGCLLVDARPVAAGDVIHLRGVEAPAGSAPSAP
jgi:BirA family biotin operon repressor/biotin-[acetyl-CoA-carboxylase] ligase